MTAIQIGCGGRHTDTHDERGMSFMAQLRGASFMVDNVETVQTSELERLVAEASPGPFRGERVVWRQSDWQLTTQVKGRYRLFNEAGGLIAETPAGGMWTKVTEQESKANADLFFYARDLAREVVALREERALAREALEHEASCERCIQDLHECGEMTMLRHNALAAMRGGSDGASS
jgi:hypothetical protein